MKIDPQLLNSPSLQWDIREAIDEGAFLDRLVSAAVIKQSPLTAAEVGRVTGFRHEAINGCFAIIAANTGHTLRSRKWKICVEFADLDPDIVADQLGMNRHDPDSYSFRRNVTLQFLSAIA